MSAASASVTIPSGLTASASDEAARVRLGASAQAPDTVLERLAADASVMVRAALALNLAAPPRANQILARDTDERVRALLARKLAGLAPELTAGEQSRLQWQAYDTLAALVADEAVRVRAAVAEVVKEMPDAPRELILRLARDCEMPVAGPVIQFSPLLTPEDLLALLDAPPSPATALAVARRPELNEAVADAIAAGEDSEAIRELLTNPSAQIREATIDALITRAVDHEDWHEPLVRRPSLPAHSARALSEIVAAHLLAVLADRADLDPNLAGALRQRVAECLQTGDPLVAGKGALAARRELSTEQALAAAERLARQGRLGEETVLSALEAGEPRLATALLAVAATVPVAVVDRAASLRNAKALVSLVWKARFSSKLLGPLQISLAHVPPASMLLPGTDGAFPLAVEEMRWQLDFLRRVGR